MPDAPLMPHIAMVKHTTDNFKLVSTICIQISEKIHILLTYKAYAVGGHCKKEIWTETVSGR